MLVSYTGLPSTFLFVLSQTHSTGQRTNNLLLNQDEKKRFVGAVIGRLKEAYGFRTDTELAKHLEMKPSTFTMQKARGSLDWLSLITKCGEADFNFVLKGEVQHSGADVVDPRSYDLNTAIGRVMHQVDVARATYAEIIPEGDPHTLTLTLLKALSKVVDTELSIFEYNAGSSLPDQEAAS